MVQRAETASPRRRKQLTDESIRMAVAGDWKGAAAANSAILDDFPDDIEAANRLGKALTELGQPKKAIDAYQRALAIDSFNSIARKNLERLEAADAAAKGVQAAKPAKAKSAAAERGTGVLVSSATAAEFRLQQANPAEIAKLDPGDPATLQANARGVAVLSAEGVILGYIEPKAGLRLRRMIEGGNTYDVKIRAVDADGHAIVFIREVRRDPSLVGQASFLASAETRRKAPRAYTRRSALVDEDEPDFGDDDDEDDDPRAELREVADVEDIDDDVDITDEIDADDDDGDDPADTDDDFEGDAQDS
ncbi:MAG: tetratricopeptide repeat protein [Chloroflexi bacterium]|nr:tetratricopeptide repeat protein [Chloroflexota bacterium]MDA1146147.1 tetratricopeptide repeat protein [Chloroflexota bacterium]